MYWVVGSFFGLALGMAWILVELLRARRNPL